MMETYRWAVLGCGAIAHEFAQAMEKEGKAIYGVANRTYEKAAEFAKKYQIANVYQDARELLNDENVDIVYIATPHNTHIQYLIEAIRQKKHALCEKSITLNSKELLQAKRLAEENHVILAEAMTIYHMPLYQKLREMARGGEFGKLKMIQMNFGSYKEYDMENRFFNPAYAGGAMLDIGVYALSFIRWFMSETPDRILSQVKAAPSGVDEQAGILFMNAACEMAVAAISLHAKQPKRGMLSFEKGYIEIYDFPRAETAVFTAVDGNGSKTISCGSGKDALRYEICDMERSVSSQKNQMHLDLSFDVMSMMTRIRKEWGIRYPEEED